jgi:predicted XRE-type DNA-binding protein
MSGETFDSVWDAICDTPEEAANMKVRSSLLTAVIRQIEGWNISQEDAARRVGLTRPRLNDLMRGKIDKFSLDALVNIATAASLVVRIAIEQPKKAA